MKSKIIELIEKTNELLETISRNTSMGNTKEQPQEDENKPRSDLWITIERLARSGKKSMEIAKEVGKSRSTVFIILRKLGFHRGNPPSENAMRLTEAALVSLKEIKDNDAELPGAIQLLRRWCDERSKP